MPKIKDKIPAIYHSFLPDFIDWDIPSEEIANCNDCVMCRNKRSAFLNTKCCTYHPQLPNYLVGGILLDLSEELNEGRRRINNNKSKYPTGVFSTTSYDSRLLNLKKKEEHKWNSSEAESVLCPYYNNGNCTIWNYRENCCSTHFCYSVGGETGKAFWKKFNEYLKLTELELSIYSLNELGINTAENPKIEDVYNRKYRENAWSSWQGSHADLYIQSYKTIAKLTAYDFHRISSNTLKKIEKEVRFAYKEFTDPSIPEILILNPKAVKKSNPINYEISYHYLYGAIEFNPLIDKFVCLFDGEITTTQVLEKAAFINIDFKEKYLKTLFLLEILIPPTSHPH